MLRAIDDHYELAAATRLQWQGFPVWKLDGRRTDRGGLSEEEASDPDEAGQGEGGIPLWVQLFIGEDDLFPYHIEFSDRPIGQNGPRDPLPGATDYGQTVAMDFFEVQTGLAIDPRLFVFKPRDHQVDDVTQAYLQCIESSAP